jgi:hypothetical protein
VWWASNGNGNNMRNFDRNKVAGVKESSGSGNNKGNGKSSRSDGLRHCNQTAMVWAMAMEAIATATRHFSCCCHCPPLQHHNQMAMASVMGMEAMAMVTRVASKRWRQWQR